MGIRNTTARIRDTTASIRNTTVSGRSIRRSRVRGTRPPVCVLAPVSVRAIPYAPTALSYDDGTHRVEIRYSAKDIS
jgi:hypothetical protein